MPDPKTLSDEELEQAINGELPEPEEPEVPEPDNPTPDPTPDPEPTPDPTPEPEEEEERPPSYREQLRIQDLLARGKPEPAKPTSAARDGALDYASELNADPSVIARLQEDRRLAEEAQYQAGLRQADAMKFETRLEIDAPLVESKYKFLDKNDKDNFNPAAANAMNTKYLNFVGFDPGNKEKGIPPSVQRPDVRYRDFVEAEMEFADEIASHKVADSTASIARQSAQTGIRPGGGSPKLNLNKAPGQMTDDELDAAIALGIPSK